MPCKARQRLTDSGFPAGTLVVNLIGCLCTGFLAAMFSGPMLVREEYRIGLMVGVLGGFTTAFSAFGLETFLLANGGEFRLALANVVASCVLGLAAGQLSGRRVLVRRGIIVHAVLRVAVLSSVGEKQGFKIGSRTAKIPEEGLLRVFIGESDKWHGRPLYEAIVMKARELHLAGATVSAGPMGFGAQSRLHTAKILRLSEDLPIVIEIVDAKEKIDELMPYIDEMVQEGLVTLEPVQVIKYRKSP